MSRDVEESESITRQFVRSSVHRQDEAVLDYYVAFSRFEYALKECGFVHGGDDGAQPDWDGFAKRLKVTAGQLYDASTDVLRKEIDALVQDPPKVQVERAGRLGWKPKRLRDHSNAALSVYVRRVRNNLFHGAKEPLTDRDRWLVSVGLNILDQFLAMSQDLKHCFSR